jgi:hypothetical protein
VRSKLHHSVLFSLREVFHRAGGPAETLANPQEELRGPVSRLRAGELSTCFTVFVWVIILAVTGQDDRQLELPRVQIL